MVFSSIMFIFRFFPIALAVYYITPKRFRNFVLFAESLFFYSWGEVKYFPIMLYSIALDYFVGLGIEKFRGRKPLMRLMLMISIIGNMGMLIFFKYTDFLIGTINSAFSTQIPTLGLVLPLGISFYTFQTMSYSIDVYRGDVKAERNIINFAAFVTLFPQLIAGPIVRYTDVANELSNRTLTFKGIERGIEEFVWGLGRKVLLANSIGQLWTSIEKMDYMGISMPLAWLGAVAFGLQIYFDFSGYSLMAIGLGRMLGFNFPQNFRNPYLSRSATEFWQRWHMTLGSWFREYLYFPLGGSRKGLPRTYLNLFVVWAFTGIWHGAAWSFMFWGLFFFVLIAIEKSFLLAFLKRHPIISRIYILPLLALSWAIFAITDSALLGQYIGTMFSGRIGSDVVFYLRDYAVVLVVCVVCCTELPQRFVERFNSWGKTVLAMLITLASVAYLVDATYNPFLYFRF